MTVFCQTYFSHSFCSLLDYIDYLSATLILETAYLVTLSFVKLLFIQCLVMLCATVSRLI